MADNNIGVQESSTPTHYIRNVVVGTQGGLDVVEQAVQVTTLPALAAGANAIGSVTVTSLPSIPAGANAIGSVAVSNFPATQPVSGTFWQATQPVSLATLPALTAGSAVIGHVIADSGSTTAVTGNVTAVQPTGSNLHVVVDSGSVTVANASVSATGAAVPASATMTGGTDGANLRAVLVDSSGRQVVNINGTVPVSGTFWQATQPISAASLPLPTGAALDASVTALQVAQASTTSGQVGNLVQGATTTAAPSYTTARTNPLSLTTTGDLRVALASLPALATGSSTIGAVTLTDGTTVANTLNTGTSGQNALLVAGASNVVSFTTNTVQAVATTDCLNMRGVGVQITSQGTSSTITFQQTNDSTNGPWVSIPAVLASTGNTASVVTSTTGTGLYKMNLTARYIRFNVTGISAGTTAGIAVFYANPFPELMQSVQSVQSGTWTVQPGNTANTTPWLVNALLNPSGTTLNTYSAHITTNATTTPTSTTDYISSIAISVAAGGTTSTVTIKDKSGTPLILVNALSTATATTTPTVINFQTPVKMTSGIDIVTAGAAAATVDVWINYYQ